MKEMGYEIESISFYEISTNKIIPISIPTKADKEELESFIISFKSFDPLTPIQVNPSKCRHCIYCNLCDKTDEDNVY